MLFQKGDKVLFIGDSISDYNRAKPVGEGLFEALGTSYVTDVAAQYTCMMPEMRLRFVNMGVSGNVHTIYAGGCRFMRRNEKQQAA